MSRMYIPGLLKESGMDELPLRNNEVPSNSPSRHFGEAMKFWRCGPTKQPTQTEGPTRPKPANAWSATSPDFLFRVPETLRSANPEAYLPRIFHFSPYAPNFFFESPSSAPPDSSALQGHPPPTANNRFKAIMVEDLLGAEMLAALVNKISALNASWKIFPHIYLQRPFFMDNVPPATLAHLFASSAAIIVSSFIFYGSSDDLVVVPRIGSQPPVIRHPIAYRYYAIMDAVISMDNQIPILLLKLACDALYERPQFAIDFDEGHKLLDLFGKYSNNDWMQRNATRLLVYVLRRSLKFVTPFPFDQSTMWNPEDLQGTLLWIERNPFKPLIAYIYDSLVRRLPPTNGEKTGNGMPAGSQTPDALPCRMVSASQLRSSGVKFRAGKKGSCFIGIEFDEKTSTLILAVITLEEDTITVVCNLMAYELTTKLEAESNLQHVASFVLFLDYLIDTEEDVKVLVEAGVLRSYMAGSNRSVAKMLDWLVDAMIINLTPEHSRIVEQLQKACQRRWGRWWASFKETYWERQPWLLLSVAAATLLLVLTVLQTAYTMKHG